MELCIECKGLSKTYEEVRALDNVTFSVEPGERVAVLGPNGAGKSTLLKILATQITSYEGVVRILGKDPLREKRYIRSQVGFLGHSSFLYDELTVEENLAYYGKMFSLKEEFLRMRIGELVDLLGLKRWCEVQVKKLSHGLRKRADIARALLHSPRLLVLDEPFSGLDKNSVDLLLELFESSKGTTIIFSSHTMELIGRACTRRLFFERGRLIKDVKG